MGTVEEKESVCAEQLNPFQTSSDTLLSRTKKTTKQHQSSSTFPPRLAEQPLLSAVRGSSPSLGPDTSLF